MCLMWEYFSSNVLKWWAWNLC